MAREMTHAELERHHYNEVRTNPQYAVEGMMDVRLEEFSMNMPICETELQEERVIQKPWEEYQWIIINQLRGEVKYLHNKLTNKGRGGGD